MNAREVLEIMVRTDRGNMTVFSPDEVRNALDAYRAEVLNAAADELADQVPPVTAGPRTPFEQGLMAAVAALKTLARNTKGGAL